MTKRYILEMDIDDLETLQRALTVWGAALRRGFKHWAADDADIDHCSDLLDKITLLRERSPDPQEG